MIGRTDNVMSSANNIKWEQSDRQDTKDDSAKVYNGNRRVTVSRYCFCRLSHVSSAWLKSTCLLAPPLHTIGLPSPSTH